MRSLDRWLDYETRPGLAAARWGGRIAPVTRALISLGLLSTLWMTPLGFLFWTSGGKAAPNCVGWRETVVATCSLGLGPAGTRVVLTLLLLPVLVGAFARASVALQWYAVVCYLATVAIPDGGDHLAMSLSTLLLPLGLACRGAWWAFEPGQQSRHFFLAVRYTRFLVMVQTGFLYAHASLGKLVVPEWLDGSAMWYWSRQGAYGFPSWLRSFSDPVLRTSLGVTAITHGTILAELFIALAVLRGRRFKSVAFIVGLALHLMISVAMGLVSFGLSMTALLIAAFGLDFADEVLSRTRFVERPTDRAGIDLLLVPSSGGKRLRYLVAVFAAIGGGSILFAIVTSGGPVVGVVLLASLYATACVVVLRRLCSSPEISFLRTGASGTDMLRVTSRGSARDVRHIALADSGSSVDLTLSSDDESVGARWSIRTHDGASVRALLEEA